MNRLPPPASGESPSVSRRTFMHQCGGLLACAAVGATFIRAAAEPVAPARAGQPVAPVVNATDVDEIYFSDPGWGG
ncbi:MAG TPA: hypothetical protein VHN79_07490 [Lacunisphaera sp.]|nr:hypothetical protein [Lacunisphaera sp.]